jgi:putative aldouronate transport system permease protein
MRAKTKALKRKRSIWQILWSQRILILMSVPLLLHRILFSYVPLYGWTMAFQNFRPAIRGVFNQTWVGLEHFELMLVGPISDRFWRAVVNTLGQSVLMLATGTLAAIFLSLLLNEMKQIGVKRVFQSILYLPFFLSMVVIANLASRALGMPGTGGVINQLLLFLRIIDEPILFLAGPQYFWGIMAGLNLWRTLGWSTIIYLAAMTGIDPALYEAAEVDGANRYKKIWYITLPGIKPTIIILLIMNLGWILNAGFDLQWLLGTGLNMPRSEILDIFILRYGIEIGNFSLATAAGIMRTVVSVLLVFTANYIARLLGQERLV